MSSSKQITVFLSANDNIDETYNKLAYKIGGLLAQAGHVLLYGGSKSGLMERIASGAIDSDGRVVAITTPEFEHKVNPDVHKIMRCESRPERVDTLIQRADAIILLPGGLGSLEEFSIAVESKQIFGGDKPIIVVNTDGFYDGLKTQIETFFKQKFIHRKRDGLVEFVDTPEAALELIDSTD